MIANMLSNKICNLIVTEIFVRVSHNLILLFQEMLDYIQQTI